MCGDVQQFNIRQHGSYLPSLFHSSIQDPVCQVHQTIAQSSCDPTNVPHRTMPRNGATGHCSIRHLSWVRRRCSIDMRHPERTQTERLEVGDGWEGVASKRLQCCTALYVPECVDAASRRGGLTGLVPTAPKCIRATHGGTIKHATYCKAKMQPNSDSLYGGTRKLTTC